MCLRQTQERIQVGAIDPLKQGSATYGPRAGSGPKPLYQIVETVWPA